MEQHINYCGSPTYDKQTVKTAGVRLHIIQFFTHTAHSKQWDISHLTRFWLKPGPFHTPHLVGLHIKQFFAHSALSNWCGIPHLTRFWLEPGPLHTSHLVMTSVSLPFLLPDDIFPLLVRALAMIGEGGVGIVSVLDVATNIWGPDNDDPSPTGIGIGLIYNKWNMLHAIIQIKSRK